MNHRQGRGLSLCLVVVATLIGACGGSASSSKTASSNDKASTTTTVAKATTVTLPAGCVDWPRATQDTPGLVLSRYSNGIGDRAGLRCIGTSPGPLIVCSEYRASGSTTIEELDLVLDGKAYRTGKATTCPAAGGTSVLQLTKGVHNLTIPSKDPNYKFTAVVS